MLKRLYIDNFRCFVNFEYKPERKQLLLGANGSGKSSLLDALRIIGDFIRNGRTDSALRALRNGKTRWLELPKQIFEIEAELGGEQYLYRLELQIGRIPLPIGISVLSESLKVGGNPIIEILNGEVIIYPIPPNNSAVRLQQQTLPEGSLFRTFAGYSEETKRFVGWISDELSCLKYNPSARRTSALLLGRTRTGAAALDPEMSNIASWYKRQTQIDIEGAINLRGSLREALEGFDSLNFGDSGTERTGLIVSFNRPEGKVSYAINELSDGQRCLIALYMILHFLIAKGHTVFLDEPDNYVSLREIQPWLLAAEQAVEESKGQLILISHHPEILNQWAQEYGLRFFREGNGHVRTEPFRSDYDGVLQPSEVIARGWEDE
jgi:predicted ATPase